MSRPSIPSRRRRSRSSHSAKPEQDHSRVYGWAPDDALDDAPHDAFGDAYVHQEIHDRALAQRLDEDQGRFRAHLALLDGHKEMHSDFAWCRADLAMVRDEGDRRIAGAASGSARRRARHECDRACDQLLACAIIWMWRCYEGVWAELRRYFDLPDILIVRAIEKAIQGTWRDAVAELWRIPRVVLAGDASHLQYQAIIAQIVTSDLPPAVCTQLIAAICADQIKRAKLPSLTPDGRPGKHALRMELYLKWRARPPGRGRTEAFIRAVADKDIPIEGLTGGELTEEGIKSQLTAARKWLAPKRDKVPVAPHAYLPPPGSCTQG